MEKLLLLKTVVPKSTGSGLERHKFGDGTLSVYGIGCPELQLEVQVETSGECSLEGLVLGLALLYIFAGGMDSGIKCTLSKSADDSKL
ncbi:hypothetical protein TURU_122243 [Turdus rufiventris]|nr:hypothetical protein TURU_122243 [Turdus rufiventris]